MINYNKNPPTLCVQVSSKRTSNKGTPLKRKKKLTKNNIQFLRLVGLIK